MDFIKSDNLYLLFNFLCLPAEGEGHEGFPPPPEGPSSTRLEALVPSRDSRARTRSPSPRAWRPDFPGAGQRVPWADGSAGPESELPTTEL